LRGFSSASNLTRSSAFRNQIEYKLIQLYLYWLENISLVLYSFLLTRYSIPTSFYVFFSILIRSASTSSIAQQIYNFFVDLLFINLLIICVNLNCQQFGNWFNLYSFDLFSAFFSILLQIGKILSVFNQFNKLIVDSALNNLFKISSNLYSCTGSRSLDLLEHIFGYPSTCYYTRGRFSFHTPPNWIIIVGIDEEYTALNNSKHIFPFVFWCPSTSLLLHLLHNKYNLLHSISKFICYNLLET
jgi:hypothetical protein